MQHDVTDIQSPELLGHKTTNEYKCEKQNSSLNTHLSTQIRPKN